MSKCWTCGSSVSGWRFNCSSCRTISALEDIDADVAGHLEDIEYTLDEIAEIQERGFEEIRLELESGFQRLATILEWGFSALNWRLLQITDILKSIDHTLKNPNLTQANEWRKMAEELRKRGVLDESKEFFLKALEINRLDYRIYTGLAQTYLHMEKFDKAKFYLEKSLPHAPKGEIDYRSYSYRLMGHIYACDEDYRKASSVLLQSIELSPNYADGHYDYAQYCALIKNKEPCLTSLNKAVLFKSLYWYLAQREQNFEPLRAEVLEQIEYLRNKAKQDTQEMFQAVEDEIDKSDSEISKLKIKIKDYLEIVEKEEKKARDKGASNYIRNNERDAYEQYLSKIKDIKSKLGSIKSDSYSDDYNSILKMNSNAEKLLSETKKSEKESRQKYNLVIEQAKNAIESLDKKIAEKRKEANRRIPRAFLAAPLLFCLIGGVSGCTIGLFFKKSDQGFNAGFWIGLLIGVIWGILDYKFNIYEKLYY